MNDCIWHFNERAAPRRARLTIINCQVGGQGPARPARNLRVEERKSRLPPLDSHFCSAHMKKMTPQRASFSSWSRKRESNPPEPAWEAGAIPLGDSCIAVFYGYYSPKNRICQGNFHGAAKIIWSFVNCKASLPQNERDFRLRFIPLEMTEESPPSGLSTGFDKR